jgi:hypothetical protein
MTTGDDIELDERSKYIAEGWNNEDFDSFLVVRTFSMF